MSDIGVAIFWGIFGVGAYVTILQPLAAFTKWLVNEIRGILWT